MRNLCTALVLLASTALAQSPAPVQVTGSFFALSVPDLNSSVQWYEQKLGLKPSMLRPAKNDVGVAILEAPGLIVELVEQNGSVPLNKGAPGVKDAVHLQGISKAGVIVDDFEGTLATLKKRGVEIAFGPFPAHDGQPSNVIVRDNNGNLIQFFGKK